MAATEPRTNVSDEQHATHRQTGYARLPAHSISPASPHSPASPLCPSSKLLRSDASSRCEELPTAYHDGQAAPDSSAQPLHQ